MAVARIGGPWFCRMIFLPGRPPVLVAIDRPLDLVGAGHRHIRPVTIAYIVQHERIILYPCGHQMGHALDAPLDFSGGEHQPGGHHRTAHLFEPAGPEQQIGDPAFILERDEHRIALAGPLADQHDAGDFCL